MNTRRAFFRSLFHAVAASAALVYAPSTSIAPKVRSVTVPPEYREELLVRNFLVGGRPRSLPSLSKIVRQSNREKISAHIWEPR